MRACAVHACLVVLCALLLGVTPGCAPPPTELIVVVDTDLAIPAELDEVEITVSSAGGVMESERQALVSDAILPLTLAVIPSGDFLGPIDVVAEGRLDGTALVSRQARVTLVRGESRTLRLHLVASCVGVDCPGGQSCGESGCTAIVVRDLSPWTGTPPRLNDPDAGHPDGGFDAGPDVGPVDAYAPDAGPIDAFVPVDAAMGPDAWVGCAVDGECDDGVACTRDTCSEGRCVHTPDDAMCEDGEQCTDDRCGATGCTFPPGTGACNDDTFCNGFDQCAGGTCSIHGGDPCDAPTVCDEAADRCRGCLVAGDCPADSTGSWGSCSYASGCDESATRERTARTYACIDGACVPSDTTQTEACTRDTDGTMCGVGSCGSYGSCNYSDSCDESATQTRSCTDLACAGGVCRSTSRDETMPCSRDTDGAMCAASSCPAFGACDYSGTCDESAMQSRSCMDFACGMGSCRSSSRTETMPCTRDTDGTSCGMASCGAYGACDYADTCDETAMQTRTCMDPVCAMSSCAATSRMESRGCTRDTDGMSCGMGLACTAGSCMSCAPTLSGAFGVTDTTYMKGVAGSGSNLTFTEGAAPMAMGSISVPGVTFSGSGTLPICIWQVVAVGNTLRFVDWDGATTVTVTVSGATVSGSSAPPCMDYPPYGCFPPCLSRVTATGNTLRLDHGAASPMGTITFGCP